MSAKHGNTACATTPAGAALRGWDTLQTLLPRMLIAGGMGAAVLCALPLLQKLLLDVHLAPSGYMVAALLGALAGGAAYTCHHAALQRQRQSAPAPQQASALELAPLSMADVDTRGRLLSCNEKCFQLIGRDRRTMQGSLLYELLAEQEQQESLQSLLLFLAAERPEPEPLKVQLAHSNGKSVDVECHWSYLHDRQGALRGFRFAFVETTELARAKAVLADALHEARATETAQAAFLNSISHELRTPLNGALGMLYLLQSAPLSPDHRRYLDIAAASTRRLANLVEEILEVRQAQSGALQLCCRPFCLSDCLDTLEREYRPRCQQKGIDLVVHQDGRIPHALQGDPGRLHKVLDNLLGNALKFTPSGSIELSAYPLPTGTPGRIRILFSVSDTGIGMPEQSIDALFTPFTQQDQGLTRRFHGAGLGLHIVKQFVTAMGGTLSVSSEEGRGTTIHFCLPFDLAA